MRSNYSVEQVANFFGDYPEKWWIAGGWAIDLFVGEITREHEDVDIAILRDDELAWRTHLKEWELWPGLGNSKLETKPINLGEKLPKNREVLWCRPAPSQPWAFELLLNKTSENEWMFKRDNRICMPISQIGLISAEGIPYLKPEIVLLFKAKNNQDKDLHDFEYVLPKLSTESREWLSTSLQLVHPNHPWLKQL